MPVLSRKTFFMIWKQISSPSSFVFRSFTPDDVSGKQLERDFPDSQVFSVFKNLFIYLKCKVTEQD